jgi:hypothetical protein
MFDVCIYANLVAFKVVDLFTSSYFYLENQGFLHGTIA